MISLTDTPLSDALLELRRKKGKGGDLMPQSDFAKEIEGSPSASTISRIEKGIMRPTDDLLERMARAYGEFISLDELKELRNQQFGAKDRRGRRKASSGPRKTKARRVEASENGASTPTAEPSAASVTSPTASTPSAPTQTPTGTAPRERGSALVRRYGAGGSPPPFAAQGRRAEETAPAASPPEASSRVEPREVVSTAGMAAPAPTAPPSRLSGKALLVEELLPSIEAFSRGLSRRHALLFASSTSLLLDRFQMALGGRNGHEATEMRAIALLVFHEVRTLLSADALVSPAESVLEDVRNKEVLMTVASPERWGIYESVAPSFVRLIAPLIPDASGEARVRLALLRGLAVGVARSGNR